MTTPEIQFAVNSFGKAGDVILPLFIALAIYIHAQPLITLMTSLLAWKSKGMERNTLAQRLDPSIQGAVGGQVGDAVGHFMKKAEQVAQFAGAPKAEDKGRSGDYGRASILVLALVCYVAPRLAAGILFMLKFEALAASGLYQYAFATLVLYVASTCGFHAMFGLVLKNAAKIAFAVGLITACVDIVIVVLLGIETLWIPFGLYFINLVFIALLTIFQAIYGFAPKPLAPPATGSTKGSLDQ